METVCVEVESIHGAVGQQRIVFYRFQDQSGAWNSYGPILTVDDSFDAEEYKKVVEDKVSGLLSGGM